MVVPHRRKSNDSARLVITTIMGVIFGFFVGLSFPSLSVNKLNRHSGLLSSRDVPINDDDKSFRVIQHRLALKRSHDADTKKAWCCVWHMIQNDLVHGWGLEFALRRCIKPAHEKISVVYSQWIIHQVILSLGNQGIAENGKAPWEGERSIAQTAAGNLYLLYLVFASVRLGLLVFLSS